MADEVVTGQDTGTPSPPSNDAPPGVQITMGGQTVTVPAEVAALYQRELNSRDGRHGTELQALRSEVAELRSSLVDDDDEPDVTPGLRPPDPDLLMTNPDEFVRQNNAYQVALINEAGAALERRHQEELNQHREAIDRDRQWEKITQRFYEKHPRFKTPEMAEVVNLVWQRHKDELAPMQVEDGLDKIAEYASKFSVAIAEQGKGEKRTPTLESSRRTQSVTPPDKTDDFDPKEHTIGNWIRKRKAARDAARYRTVPAQA